MPTAKLVIHDEVNVELRGVDPDTLYECMEELTYYVPGYMHMAKVKLGWWDGRIRLMKASGFTQFNLIEYIDPTLIHAGYNVEIDDRREWVDTVSDKLEYIDENYLNGFLDREGNPITLWAHQVKGVNTAIQCGQGVLELATGAGKAQPLTSLISTPTGWKSMGDMQVGDEVSTWNSNVTTVTGVYPQGTKTLYEIEFQDGRVISCCDEHLWYVYDKRLKRNKNRNGLDRFEAIPAKTIKRIIDEGNGGSCLQIPLTPTEYPKIEYTISPYVMGALLGDGNLKKEGITFSTADPEMIDLLHQEMDNPITKIPNSKYDYYIGAVERHSKTDALLVGLRDFGLRGKLSYEKFIPETYLYGSILQRYDLLQGLMDTDGYVSWKGNMSFTTTSTELSLDVQKLIWSLGGTAKITDKVPTYTYQGESHSGRKAYTVWIQLPNPISAVRLSRKKEFVRKTQYSDGLSLRITDVREMGEAPMQCISVADPSKIYMTDNYIVTHNTIICGIMSKLWAEHGRVVIIVPTIDLALQTHIEFERRVGVDAGIWYGERKERKQITIATWQSLDHFPELFNEVICVIVDEVHQAKAQVLGEMLVGPASHVPFRFGCTGTLPKEDLFRKQIEGSIGKHIYVVRSKYLQDLGVLAKAEIFQIRLADSNNPRWIKAAPYHEMWKDELDWMFSDEERLAYMAITFEEIAEEYGNTLILLQYRDHAKKLAALLPEAVSLDGRDKNRLDDYEKFNKGNNGLMICTYGIASTGIDIPRIFNLGIVEPGKKFEKVMQTLGRSFRIAADKKHVNIFDIFGDSGLSKKHAASRRTFYKEAQQPIQIIDVEYYDANSDG